MVEIVLAWLAFSIVAGVIAGAKGRSGVGYTLLSMIFSPLIGLIPAVALPRIEPAPEQETHRKCPECAELILREARK